MNKVETRVELLWNVLDSPSITDAQREQIMAHLRPRIDSEGMLHVVAQDSRSQWKNREHAVERFVDLLRRAVMPKTRRIPTKVSRAAKQRRYEEKKKRGQVKRLRRRGDREPSEGS